MVSEWCQRHPGIRLRLEAPLLVLRPSSQGTKGPYRHARHSPSLHRRMYLQPVVETPRMRPLSKGSLDPVVALDRFEEIIRRVLGFGFTRVVNLETP